MSTSSMEREKEIVLRNTLGSFLVILGSVALSKVYFWIPNKEKHKKYKILLAQIFLFITGTLLILIPSLWMGGVFEDNNFSQTTTGIDGTESPTNNENRVRYNDKIKITSDANQLNLDLKPYFHFNSDSYFGILQDIDDQQQNNFSLTLKDPLNLTSTDFVNLNRPVFISFYEGDIISTYNLQITNNSNFYDNYGQDSSAHLDGVTEIPVTFNNLGSTEFTLFPIGEPSMFLEKNQQFNIAYIDPVNSLNNGIIDFKVCRTQNPDICGPDNFIKRNIFINRNTILPSTDQKHIFTIE